MNKYSLLLFDSLMVAFPSHKICKFHSLALNGLDLSTELIDNHFLLLKLLFCSCKCGRDEDIWIQLQWHVTVSFFDVDTLKSNTDKAYVEYFECKSALSTPFAG